MARRNDEPGDIIEGNGGRQILQGIGLLPGSFMAGQPKWAVYGAIVPVADIGMLIVARMRVSP